jgi:AcrR family transcriptional regulator
MVRLSERRKELLNSMMQNAIHSAAVAVLTEHGIGGMTMDRVAEKAEVAKGSLYKYFPNKAELMRFVHRRAIEPLVRVGQEIIDSDATAPHKLAALVRNWLEYLDKHRGLFSFFALDATVRGMLQREQESDHALGVKYLAIIIEQGIQDGLFRPLDAAWAAGCIFGAIRHMCEQQLSKSEPWQTAAESEKMVDFFLRSLTSSGS